MRKTAKERADALIELIALKHTLSKGTSQMGSWVGIYPKDINLCKQEYPNKFIAIGEYWYYCPDIYKEPIFLIISSNEVHTLTLEEFKTNIKSLDRAVAMAKIILKECE